jgi:hypothetical protein
MVVSKLIAILREMPQDALVVVRGYEDGYDDVENVRILQLELNPAAWNRKRYDDIKDSNWFIGVYAQVSKKEKPENPPIDAVFIQQYDDDDKHILKRKEL